MFYQIYCIFNQYTLTTVFIIENIYIQSMITTTKLLVWNCYHARMWSIDVQQVKKNNQNSPPNLSQIGPLAHGLCCVVFFAVFYDNELIAVSMLVGVKDFILCWNCGTIPPFEGECVRRSSSCQFCDFCYLGHLLLLFCSQWFCYCSLYLWCDTVICDNEQAYDTQCLSQGHVLFLSRPVLFPVCF